MDGGYHAIKKRFVDKSRQTRKHSLSTRSNKKDYSLAAGENTQGLATGFTPTTTSNRKSGHLKRTKRTKRRKRDSSSSPYRSFYNDEEDDGRDEFFRLHAEDPPSAFNSYFLVVMLVLLSLNFLVALAMLLPLKKLQPKNPHIPALLWLGTILASVSFRTETSIHTRSGLGWALLETFLIWVTLPWRMKMASFYSLTFAILFVTFSAYRERHVQNLSNQVWNIWNKLSTFLVK